MNFCSETFSFEQTGGQMRIWPTQYSLQEFVLPSDLLMKIFRHERI